MSPQIVNAIGVVAVLAAFAYAVHHFLSRRPPVPRPPAASVIQAPAYFQPPPSQPAPEIKLVNLLLAHKRETDAERELRKAKETLDGLTEWASKPDPAPPSAPPNA